MSKIRVLDCTLRDGGYINNWEFGKENIKEITNLLSESNTEIIELGFLRDEANYSSDRAVWNDMHEVEKFIPCNRKSLISVMGEIFNPYPLEKIPVYHEGGVDILRIICWRKMQNEAIKYCKSLIEKGYKVCIQPDRVNQYSLEDFKDLCVKYAEIKPYAIYVVDSNGFLSQNELLEYFKAADSVLPKEIKLGYHGHNSIMQAEGAAELFVDCNFDRDIIIDASVYGIGRASGNLNIEIFSKYLNENFDKNYNISSYLKIYENYIKPIYLKSPWGYSAESFLSSLYRCNPNYATILKKDYGLGIDKIEKVIKLLSDEDRVITNRSILPELVARIDK